MLLSLIVVALIGAASRPDRAHTKAAKAARPPQKTTNPFRADQPENDKLI